MPLKDYCTPRRQLFDAGRLTGAVLRHRQPGDRFAPLGLGGTKKLKAYLSELGLPQPDRDACPLVAQGENVLWVLGHAVSEDAAVTATTKRIIQIEVCDATEL